MKPLEDIQRGLFLPKRKTWIEWGALYDDLASTADRADNWLPCGHTERYGQLHWSHECLLPLKPNEEPWDSLDGGVVAFVRGSPLTVRQFWITAGDKSYFRESVFQYHLWMLRLAKRFGPPEIPTDHLTNGQHIVPPCNWRLGPVTISLSYIWARDTDQLNVSVSHASFPL